MHLVYNNCLLSSKISIELQIRNYKSCGINISAIYSMYMLFKRIRLEHLFVKGILICEQPVVEHADKFVGRKDCCIFTKCW